MRVISGKYKGKILSGFDIKGTRPTMDRVKESMFAIIQNYLKDSICLDLFAGSGSLGIEALSNGAKKCYFVDNNKVAIETIKKNTLKIDNKEIIQEDCFKALLQFKNKVKFDVIFLDPPYHDNLLNQVLEKIIEYNLLNKNGIIVCELEDELLTTNLTLLKEKKYGSKQVKIFLKSNVKET